MRTRFVVIFAALVALKACARQPTFHTVASVRDLMDATVHPSAEVIFESVGTIISVKGIEEIAPQNDEEWANVRRSAITVAEAGNLLMMGERPKDKGEWMNRARALIDAGILAKKAAEAKNPEALFNAGGIVYEACQQCHERYKKDRLP
jgi:hypothetical protein